MKRLLMLLFLDPRADFDEIWSQEEIRADDGDHADEVFGAHGYEGGPEGAAVVDEAVGHRKDKVARLRG